MCAAARAGGRRVYTHTYYLDPQHGDDQADGLTEQTPLKSFAPFETRPIGLKPATRIALKRGSRLRLAGTIRLHGSSAGWVLYGAYGDDRAPKPLLIGSIELAASAWSAADANGIRSANWADFRDTNEHRSLTGVEQGPGNLWFFDEGDRLASFGFRHQHDVGAGCTQGDWFYDATSATIRLCWPQPTPPLSTEASVNRTMLDPTGQQHLIIEDLDLRYGGGYAIRGSELQHLRVRRVDLSFIGGGTKNGAYVRLGNGFEVSGNASDVIVEDCRVHQAYDTGLDPQNVGSVPVTQSQLVFRRNLISYPGLAGFELWLRPAGSTLRDVLVENNTVLNAGRGWGYEQHDHQGQAKIGAALAILQDQASGSGLVIRHNVFAAPRVVVLSEFAPADARTRAFVRGLSMVENLWNINGLGAVLFEGTRGQIEPDLAGSPVFASLGAWQQNTEVPAMDVGSLEADPQFDRAADPLTEDRTWLLGLAADDDARPIRFGAFALRGDYHRTQATQGVGWGI